MSKRLAAAAFVSAVLGATSFAGAHSDPNADSSANRCDIWSRTGHTHDHTDNSDIPLGDALHSRVHSHSGHHVLRNDLGYVEVVGGQAYRGPDPSGNDFDGQGGFVQGEIDVASGVPDLDYNIAFFGPDVDHPPALDAAAILAWSQAGYGKVCVSVANTRVNQELPV